ncbi:hypothetical protein CPB84DRAFT_1548676 [Gymnopilus junonius]|uniref:Uncharacterized protein n=1 Tax=Gymnopilus junonius TaxID=109634 RepID=A0A9P5NJ03_GYMJU|nr:hypothetical protein CPB84DRAFT_1548676 [Gymnopilus junonius]
MVNRGAILQKSLPAEDSDDEFELPGSQESNGDSSRQEIAKMLEKLYSENLEKKKAQREKKILEYAETQLNDELKASAKVVEDAMNEIESLYETFLMEYAACEDRIRQKWTQLYEAETELLRFGEERQKEDNERFNAASKSHDNGLSKMKGSCKLFHETINRFFPRDVGEDSS